MLIVGLTGGVGMGKSTADRLLRRRGVPVIDTDELARDLVQPGRSTLQEVIQTFGSHLLRSDGTLDRHALAAIVFADAGQRQKLERILHPHIRALWRAQVDGWRKEGRGVGVVVIPLLFETGAETDLDRVICVASSRTTQAVRLAARGWTAEQIRGRIGAQLPIEEKTARSNYVIWTEGSLDIHARQLDLVLNRL